MQVQKWMALPIAVLMATSAVAPAFADQADGIEKVTDAIEVFEEIMGDRNTRIPPSLIENSNAIAIIPDLVQGGFIVGGRRGKGIMMVRQPDGSWSNPAFLNLTGGSFGLQFGGQSSDIILLFRDREAVEDVLNGDFEFGVNASGTAGPVGDSALDASEAAGDILSYSRSEGLFGGVALEGGELGFDKERNEDFYGQRNIQPEEIFTNRNLAVPRASAAILTDLFGTLGLPSFSGSASGSTSAPATPPSTSSSASPSTSSSATTSRGETVQLAGVFDPRKAKNAARQAAEEANGGLGNYQAEVSMHGPIAEAPFDTNPDGSWTFKFFGGRPGWEAYGQAPTVESVVTVTPGGEVRIDYNGPVR